MLTDHDVQKIIDAGSQVFATKAELGDHGARVDAKFGELLASLDGYTRKADTFMQELVVTRHQVERHEQWLHQIDEKLNLKLEY